MTAVSYGWVRGGIAILGALRPGPSSSCFFFGEEDR